MALRTGADLGTGLVIAVATCPGLPGRVRAGTGRAETDAVDASSSAGAVVIYRSDRCLWHLRHEVARGRGSLVSEGSWSRGLPIVTSGSYGPAPWQPTIERGERYRLRTGRWRG